MRLFISQLKTAKNDLEDAQIALCGAVTAHAEAKRALELREAMLTVEGLKGRNEKERAAKLLLELGAEHMQLAYVEDRLSEARCAYELARLEWNLARYQVRLLGAEGLRAAA